MVDHDGRLPAAASVKHHTQNGNLGRKGGMDQRRAIVCIGVVMKLRTRSPSASCPVTVREMNNSNDVGSPAVVVGKIMYGPRCLHRDVLAPAPITKPRSNCVRMVDP